MSNIGSGNGSSYPTSLDTQTSPEVDSPNARKTKARAAVPNDLAAAIIAVQTTLGTKSNPLGSYIDVKLWGALGDGSTDDTSAIALAIAALPADGGYLRFPFGNYKITSAITITSKNIYVDAGSATFTLSGNNAGFFFHGISTYSRWNGGYFVGDNTNRDADTSKKQIALSFGNLSGDSMSNIHISNVYIEKTNIGILIADGRTGATDDTHLFYNIHIDNCTTKNIIGTVAGVGYGIQLTQCHNSCISNCVSDSCQRHGIYVSEGGDSTITNCHVINHRTGLEAGVVRGSMAISRSKGVSVSNCNLKNNNDVGINIDADSQGLSGYNLCENISVTGCTFYNNYAGDIWIGEQTGGSINGIVKHIVISGNTMEAVAGDAGPGITIHKGKYINIFNNLINYNEFTQGISLTGADDPSYTDYINISNNSIYSSAYAIAIVSSIATGTSNIKIWDNNLNSATAHVYFSGSVTTVTNTNIISNDPEEYNIASATPTVSFGVNFSISQGGATNVTNLLGGYVGQLIYIHFADSNSTLTNTNLYLSGAINYNPPIRTQIVFKKRSNGWHELSRSSD